MPRTILLCLSLRQNGGKKADNLCLISPQRKSCREFICDFLCSPFLIVSMGQTPRSWELGRLLLLLTQVGVHFGGLLTEDWSFRRMSGECQSSVSIGEY